MKHEHGGDIYTYAKKMAIKEEELIDFSVNINPFGMPLPVREVLVEKIGLAEVYPDTKSRQLVKALSQKHQVSEEHILCGNGAADLIFRVTQVIKPQVAWVLAPTFAEYEQALKGVGCEVRHFCLEEANQFQLNNDFLDVLTSEVDIVFLCNPNNPTGQVIPTDVLHAVIEKCVENHIYIMIDECFMEFVDKDRQVSSLEKVRENKQLIILKAFTKLYALAGIRLGYALVGDIHLKEKLEEVSQPWAVSSLAQVAGVEALKCDDYVNCTLKHIKEERERCIQSLEQKGMKVYGSFANFIFFKAEKCNDLKELMLSKNILIRDCSNYIGLSKGYYRIGVQTKEKNELLRQAIDEIFVG